MVNAGEARLSGVIRGGDALIKNGAVVRPVTGDDLRFVLTGTLTVEAGAKVSVTGRGYAGGTPGGTPAGIAGAQRDAGGSHGGRGVVDTHAGPAGPVYDGVYVPRLAGGGGGHTGGGAGGGLLAIDAAALVLDGELLAKGNDACAAGAGAGGTVLVRADVVRGGGSIDASGGGLATGCGSNTGAGGGGRVAIYTDDFDGFDPAAQIRAYGGWTWNAEEFAAPGTIYTQVTGQPAGSLIVDAGEHNGADRPSPVVELPALGGGAVATLTAEGANARVAAGRTAAA